MSILLDLPRINRRKLDDAKHNLEAALKSESNPIYQNLIRLTINSLDYSPSDITIEQLPFFNTRYADDFANIIEKLSAFDNFDPVNDVFWLAFYMHALQFEVTGYLGKFNEQNTNLGSYLETNFSSFPSEIQQRIRYVGFKLGADIAKLKFNKFIDSKFEEIKSKTAELKEYALRIENWDKKLLAWEEKVNAQELRLKDHLINLNFVGLSSAFKSLCSEKISEKNFHAVITWLICSSSDLI